MEPEPYSLEQTCCSVDLWLLQVSCARCQAGSRIGCDFIDDKKKNKIGREREKEGTGEGEEGRNDDKGMGGGLDDGVMCCFRANCFCDSGTTSFIAIGYNQELIEASANEAACNWV